MVRTAARLPLAADDLPVAADHVVVVGLAGMIAQPVARPAKLHGTCILSVTYITYEGAKRIESRAFSPVWPAPNLLEGATGGTKAESHATGRADARLCRMESARASGNEAARDPVHHAGRTRSTRLVHCRCLARRSGRSSGNRGPQRAAIVWPEGPRMKSAKPVLRRAIGAF